MPEARRTHRTVRRATAGLAALAAGLGTAALADGGALAAPVTGASTHAARTTVRDYTVTAIHVLTHVGPHRSQACRVAADLYVPKGVTRRHRAPAILTTNGFGGSKDDGNQSATGKGFAGAGYIVLSYSGLGFGGSQCKIHLDDPRWDGRAGKQLVDVLAGKRSYTDDRTGKHHRLHLVAQEKPGDPRVGMIGGSYGGEIQYAVAEQDPRVDAIIPIITWNDLSYSLAPNNTSQRRGVTYRTPGVAKREWIDLFFGDGIADGVQGSSVQPERNAPPCPNFADGACPAALELNTLGYPDSDTLHLARHASVATYLRRIHVPTLLVQGQADTLFNLQEAAATFRALRHQSTPARMVWQSWGHSQSTPAPGELDLGAASIRDSYLGRRFLHWMDHYVRGRRSAPVGPTFSYFRDWVHYDTSPARAGRAVAKAYATRQRFTERPTATLFLSGTGDLVARRDAVAAGTARFVVTSDPTTSYSETSGVEGNQVKNPPSDDPGTYAGFATAPLARAAVLVGSPRLSVRLDAPSAAVSQQTGPAGHLVLFVKLYDVAPDGTLTLQHRLISPVRVTDVTKPVHVTLPAVVQRVPKGHRLELRVAAGDTAYAPNDAQHAVGVVTGPRHPGRLGLPLTTPLRLH